MPPFFVIYSYFFNHPIPLVLSISFFRHSNLALSMDVDPLRVPVSSPSRLHVPISISFTFTFFPLSYSVLFFSFSFFLFSPFLRFFPFSFLLIFRLSSLLPFPLYTVYSVHGIYFHFVSHSHFPLFSFIVTLSWSSLVLWQFSSLFSVPPLTSSLTFSLLLFLSHFLCLFPPIPFCLFQSIFLYLFPSLPLLSPRCSVALFFHFEFMFTKFCLFCQAPFLSLLVREILLCIQRLVAFIIPRHYGPEPEKIHSKKAI